MKTTNSDSAASSRRAKRTQAMTSIGGKHHQARTRRELTYWCAYEVINETEIFYVAVISEGRDYLGQHEARLPFDPAGVPARDLARMVMLRHLDRTRFGQGKPPDPRWIGWCGPYL